MIVRCPESASGQHSPADRTGRCAWCGGRSAPAPAPRPGVQRFEPSELTEAYGRHYDPDHDALTPDQIRHRYQLGQDV